MAPRLATAYHARISRTRSELVEQSLYRIASILLRIGLDAPAAEKLIRRAFILAARDSARTTSARPTQSQIALLAGISRREVRTLGKSRSQMQIGSSEWPGSPLMREVVRGWCNDSRFVDLRGKPRPLALDEGKNNFDRLVKLYGRDVTTKTLKDQLIRKGAARERNGKIVLLARSEIPKRDAADSDLKFLASQLQDIDFQLGRRAYITKKISISASDRKSARRIRRQAMERLAIVLNSIGSLALNPDGVLHTRKTPRFRVLLSTAIAIEDEDGK